MWLIKTYILLASWPGHENTRARGKQVACPSLAACGIGSLLAAPAASDQPSQKYEAERKKWLERKKHYKEVEYPAYKAEKRRREAAAEQLKRAPEVRQRREQRAKHAEERKLQREEERQRLLLKRRARWVLPYRKAKWAVSEERREQERHAVRCHGIIGWKQCKLLSCHPYEHARPLKDGGMFCAWHASQGEVPGWRERLADVQEEEYYAVRVCLEGRPPPSFGPSGVQ